MFQFIYDYEYRKVGYQYDGELSDTCDTYVMVLLGYDVAEPLLIQCMQKVQINTLNTFTYNCPCGEKHEQTMSHEDILSFIEYLMNESFLNDTLKTTYYETLNTYSKNANSNEEGEFIND